MVNEILPSMTEIEANELTTRVLSTCRFEPSVAEIVAEWQAMRRTKRGTVPVWHDEPRRVNPRHLAHLRQARDSLGHRPRRDGGISDDIVAFARAFFPDMSDALIERNYTQIASCRADRARDRAEGSGYLTTMHLTSQGEITLSMERCDTSAIEKGA